MDLLDICTTLTIPIWFPILFIYLCWNEVSLYCSAKINGTTWDPLAETELNARRGNDDEARVERTKLEGRG